MCQVTAEETGDEVVLAVVIGSLHGRDEHFQPAVRLVDIAGKIREVGMQVDFCARDPSVTPIPADLKEIHATSL
jgi:hypothetical protein